MMRWAVMKKKTDGFTAQEKAAMEELCGAMMELLTKPYEQHMIDFLCDAEHYFGMTRNDFAPWEGRVLLILSEDDTTFTPACREDLIALMPSPTVVTDLTGGHLALMVRLEQYADLRRDLSSRPCDKIYSGADIVPLLFFQHIPDGLGRTSKLLLKSVIEVGYAVVSNRRRYLLHRHIALL